MALTPFFVGFVIMSLSSLAIYATGSKLEPTRHHTYYHATVPFIAATAYLAMAFGIGDVLKIDGTVTLMARYADWTFTTPILLAGLVLTALHERKEASGFLVAIIALDVLMIVTGLISSLAVIPFVKLVWFLWSTAAFLGVLYILWVPLRALSRSYGGPLDPAYTKNLSVLSIVWILYPVVFAVGPEGIQSMSPTASAWAILVLDVIAKVVYAFFAATNIDRAVKSMRREGHAA